MPDSLPRKASLEAKNRFFFFLRRMSTSYVDFFVGLSKCISRKATLNISTAHSRYKTTQKNFRTANYDIR